MSRAPVSAVDLSKNLRRSARYVNCTRYRATGATPAGRPVSVSPCVLLMSTPYTRAPVVAKLAN
ncbi:hypothetical protein AU099_gp68 [Gordonia phage GTE8]|uniref:Uncharacterized protein n=1 Tax=Gordonia phage GTE8 TaxID=1647475 RepID=A0A0K0N6Z1_9CAUD|nr:hypothetical protein AU099_gp68 [Gordonia phage GTE8]AKJ72411.1 hypothetical protein GTE8_68 [Gordonia phage GTE8]